MSRKQQIKYMREYLDYIKYGSGNDKWQTCFICRQNKINFVSIENIMVPVCEKHLTEVS